LTFFNVGSDKFKTFSASMGLIFTKKLAINFAKSEVSRANLAKINVNHKKEKK